LSITTVDDYAASTATTGSLAIGASLHASLEQAGDNDWFRVHLEAGTSYRFSLSADDPDGWNYTSVWPMLLKPSGSSAVGVTMLDSMYPHDTADNRGFTPIASGDYYFSVRSSGATGGYTLSLAIDSAPVQDEVPGTEEGALALALDSPYNGSINGRGDIDMYSITLEAGESYTVFLGKAAGSAIEMGQMLDGQPYSGYALPGQGGQVIQIDNSLYGQRTIKIPVFASNTASGSYQISYSRTADHDGFTGDTQTTGYLTGTGLRGNLEQAGSADWVHVYLEAGKSYALELYAAASSGYTLGRDGTALPKLSLLDASGNLITSATGGGLDGDPRIEFSVPASSPSAAAYFLAASGGTGTYALAKHEIVATAAGDVSDDPATGQLLVVGAQVASRIDKASDADYFMVKLSAGVTYEFDIATPLVNGRDGYVYSTLAARDSAASLGAYSFPGGGHYQITYKAAASAYYVLGLSQANFVGEYRIAVSVSAQQDDVGDTLATATLLAPGAGPRQASITPYQDVDMYRVHLEQGQRYEFYLDGGDFSAGGLWNGAALQLLDASGAALGGPATDTGSSVAHLSYTAAAAGDYYLKVWSGGTTAGSYRVGVERGDDSGLPPPLLAQGSVNSTNGAVRLDGSASAGAQIGFYTGGRLLGSTVADGKGDFSFQLAALADGLYEVVAVATTAGGRSSFPSNTSYVWVDTVAPYAPTLQAGIPSGNTVTLSGLAEVGTMVKLWAGGVLLGEALSGRADAWNLTLTLPNGSYAITATSEDGVGNVSAASVALRLQLSSAVVPAPTLALDDAGLLFTSQQVRLSGTAQAGVQVYVVEGSAVLASAMADGGGHWTALTSVLADGSHVLAARAVDSGGTSSATSAALAVQAHIGAAQTGGAGADTITLAAGSHVVDGGAGLDTVLAAGPAPGYTLARTASGLVLGAGDGAIALLQNVERIQFSDAAWAYDSDGVAGQVYRLYQAAFGRQPDQAGLGYWIAQMDKGMSLHEVADGFVHSAEYTALYGASPTSAELVARLYQNVLHRAPDAAGEAYWTGVLQQGASVADVLGNFSESPENQAQVIGAIQGGMAYLPYV
jgi:hypothetical protein